MIKVEKISNPEKNASAKKELKLLTQKLNELRLQGHTEYLTKLKGVNLELWHIEDKIREKEKAKKFDQEFIELARSVYMTNDRRFDIKNDINQFFGSDVVEVKSYQKY